MTFETEIKEVRERLSALEGMVNTLLSFPEVQKRIECDRCEFEVHRKPTAEFIVTLIAAFLSLLVIVLSCVYCLKSRPAGQGNAPDPAG